jgi:hypothetical protein
MSRPEDLAALRATMVAALYGELGEPERRALLERVAGDPALQAEWEELQEAQALLRRAEVAEPMPEFVFLAPALPETAPRATRPRTRAWGGWRLPAIGFALATAALLALMVGGLRVDRMDHGLALHWGPSPVPVPAGTTLAGIPIEPAGSGAAAEAKPADPSRGTYLTRNELVAYTQELVRVMGSDLTDYDQRRSGETVYMVREAFDELARRHQLDYERLDARVDGIERGLAALAVTPATGSPERERNQ